MSTVAQRGGAWLPVVAMAAFVGFALAGALGWIDPGYPDAWTVSIAVPLNAGMTWFIENFGFIFKAVSQAMSLLVKAAQWLLHGLPWVATLGLTAALAWRAGGRGLVIFTLIAGLYIAAFGYWEPSMNTLALVMISVPLSVLVGFGIGAWGFYSPRARTLIMPTLDVLQTVPAFAYLIPILLLFGFGTTVGLVASILFAFPPMVRNTIVGLQSVPAAIVESGEMSGANGWQLFWLVRLPAALRQVLLGVNQTTMAALSMVVIASIIGGTADIGWEVIRTMRKAQFGDSILAGIVIALIAMVMDRITWGLAMRAGRSHLRTGGAAWRRWLGVALALGAVWAAAQLVPALGRWPDSATLDVAPAINQAVDDFVRSYGKLIKTVKNQFFFFVMLPVKSGMPATVKPFTWGFELTPWHIAGYWLSFAAVALWAWRRFGRFAGLAVVLAASIYFFGLTNIPWPAYLILVTASAWRLGGARLALGAALGLGFLLVTGSWEKAVLSLYIVGLAVVFSFSLGTALGVWAAQSDRVSAILRPISDTLQTMPLFVILIPFVMLFRIGEFSALLSIMAYAIVPAIRYAEHGLRNLPPQVLEAATSIGATPRQMLFQVKLPMAAPVMLLGLNQTIMYAISMLVIAALVGTNGLGQQVYIGLSDGDFGVGITAGIGMAVLAIIADRLTQAWSRTLRGARADSLAL